jgi:hypothetical protein
MNARYGAHSSRQYAMRPRQKPHRKYLCEGETQFRLSKDGKDLIIAPEDYSHQHTTLEHFTMTQHSIKKGLKLYGKDGETAVISEMQQLHNMECMEPKATQMLSCEEKIVSLRYLMFLKQKRCRRIKGRECADGHKHRLYKTKAETSALTVAIKSMFLTSVVDAKEGRHVISLEIPGAFMQTDIDELIHVRLECAMVLLRAKVNPCLCTEYLSKERGQDVMFRKLKKALYGTLQVALLFLKDLTRTLLDMGLRSTHTTGVSPTIPSMVSNVPSYAMLTISRSHTSILMSSRTLSSQSWTNPMES